MAATGTLNGLTEDLIAHVAKTGKDTPRFRTLKRRVDDAFRSPLYGRTDQFAVARQLEGLQEKFQVLSRDDLADALRPRLDELNEAWGSLSPELLSFLLQLADRPAHLSRVDRIKKSKPEKEESKLSWSDLDATGAAYCDEDIWESVDYGAGSSDEDEISSLSSDSQVPRAATRASLATEDDYVIPDDVFSCGEDEDLVTSIRNSQFWRDETNPGSKREKVASRVISELQLARETIFMLQGLPTSLFRRLDGKVEVDRRYTLSHLSPGALASLLRSVSSCGSRIDILRRFIDTPQTAGYMQTFHRSVEDCLRKFDMFLSELQSQYLSQSDSVAVSLLQLSDDVQRESRLLISLADLVSDFERHASGKSIRCLDLLYDLVCMTQAAGDDEAFTTLANIFYLCFDTYSRPIRRWIETGRLEDSEGTFVRQNTDKADLRTLWHDWYTLDTRSGFGNVPKFVQPFAERLFVTGKSAVFLKQLNVSENLEPRDKATFSFEDICPSDSSSFCLPFYALLESAFSNMVIANHNFISSLLRKELDERCGLWVSLQALEHIYLCKDISMIGPIDAKIFELIDRGKGGWSDRFLLTELAQSAFSTMPVIDPSRLIVRSAKVTDNSRSRSVKILDGISFDYILPWPVANIITKDGIAAYQRISTFLMQVRRAKYTIVKQRLQYSHDSMHQSEEGGGRSISFAIRHNMLWFLNVLYSHLTDFVISSTTEFLRETLSAANDVDAMIAAHRSYMASLEEQCLLSQNLHPLHQATLTILDLCIAFADLHATRSQSQFDPTKTPRKRPATRPLRTGMTPTPRKTRYEYSYGDEDTDEDVDEETDSDDEAPKHRPTSSHGSHYRQRLKDIQEQFNRLVSFMVSGLKGVGRVDGRVSWEMLAERLEWRRERPRGGLE
ncbi:Spc98 family-domain-containing protein [Aspergillus egyptiacus]|nr:Spc98 family-domain-containing protein [Aspergillus egyptiacus]